LCSSRARRRSSRSLDFSKYSPGEQACARTGDREIADLRATHDRMVEHFRRDEKLPYVQLNRAIHEAIMKAAGNETLIEVYHMLYARLGSVLSAATRRPRAGTTP
jgi:DNA-binding GntR family transcriptional regulator